MDPLLSALGVFLIVVAVTALTSAVALGVHPLRSRHRQAFEQGIAEVGHLMDDMERLLGRVMNLQKHFGQTNEDLLQILISAEKVEKRASRIKEVEFDGEEASVAGMNVIPAPLPPRLQARK
jgi:DNA recombination protein RmuC